jgi:hypothetical protein
MPAGLSRKEICVVASPFPHSADLASEIVSMCDWPSVPV